MQVRKHPASPAIQDNLSWGLAHPKVEDILSGTSSSTLDLLSVRRGSPLKCQPCSLVIPALAGSSGSWPLLAAAVAVQDEGWVHGRCVAVTASETPDCTLEHGVRRSWTCKLLIAL